MTRPPQAHFLQFVHFAFFRQLFFANYPQIKASNYQQARVETITDREDFLLNLTNYQAVQLYNLS